jgi:uncharacterized protein with ParB-like and HNH nuclease domain
MAIVPDAREAVKQDRMDLYMNHKLRNQTVPVWAIARLLDEGSLRLPSFQRDAVWDKERVELLWDSLLRGIPLGNLVRLHARW